MDLCNCSVTKITLPEKWMAHADSPKEASTVKKMNGQPQLLSSDKMTQYFKEQTKLCFEKNILSLQKFEASS